MPIGDARGHRSCRQWPVFAPSDECGEFLRARLPDPRRPAFGANGKFWRIRSQVSKRLAEGARIAAVAAEHGIVRVAHDDRVNAPHSHAVADAAVALVREGKAQALMKGSLNTDELMSAVVARDAGLRTERRISHCFVMDVPGRDDPLI